MLIGRRRAEALIAGAWQGLSLRLEAVQSRLGGLQLMEINPAFSILSSSIVSVDVFLLCLILIRLSLASWPIVR